MNGGMQNKNNITYKNKYLIKYMEKIETIRNYLLKIYNYMDDIQFDDDVYSVDKINQMLNKIKKFTTICTFNELISIARDNHNVYDTIGKIYLPVGYLSEKKRYEKYFNVDIKIDDENDYFYAYFFSIFREPLFVVYDKINKVIPNILSKSIYNAMLVIYADNLIFDDKIDKGIIIKKITKNSDGEIVNIEFEEIDGMYENIYGRKEK